MYTRMSRLAVGVVGVVGVAGRRGLGMGMGMGMGLSSMAMTMTMGRASLFHESERMFAKHTGTGKRGKGKDKKDKKAKGHATVESGSVESVEKATHVSVPSGSEEKKVLSIEDEQAALEAEGLPKRITHFWKRLQSKITNILGNDSVGARTITVKFCESPADVLKKRGVVQKAMDLEFLERAVFHRQATCPPELWGYVTSHKSYPPYVHISASRGKMPHWEFWKVTIDQANPQKTKWTTG